MSTSTHSHRRQKTFGRNNLTKIFIFYQFIIIAHFKLQNIVKKKPDNSLSIFNISRFYSCLINVLCFNLDRQTRFFVWSRCLSVEVEGKILFNRSNDAYDVFFINFYTFYCILNEFTSSTSQSIYEWKWNLFDKRGCRLRSI